MHRRQPPSVPTARRSKVNHGGHAGLRVLEIYREGRMTRTPRPRGIRRGPSPLPQGHQHEVSTQEGSKMHSAQRPPGQIASQSASDLQIGSGEEQMPTFEQMHSSGSPTHPPQSRQNSPNWHWGQPPAHTYCCANAGVRRLVSTGADHATAAPAPMRFSIDRREIPLGGCPSMKSPFI